jgi:beta-N-acetylhexosaminidase
MKAVSARYAVPAAAVEAIQAGCDAVLVCSGDVDLQAQTLEALVRAVEIRRHHRGRLDDAGGG